VGVPRLPLVALLAFSVLLARGPARFDLLAAHAAAQAGTRALGAELTRRGRTLVSGRVMGFWSNDTPQYYAGNNTWSLRADPAITYFLGDHLGLGAALSFGWSRGGLFPSGDYRARDFALGGEFVWSAALAPRWRLLLRPFLGYARQWSSTRNIEVSTGTMPIIFGFESAIDFMRFSASLPLIYALNENIGLGLAPEYVFEIPVAQRERPTVQGIPSGGFNFSSRGAIRRSQLGLSLGLYASF
jgi:hypothetical protein